MPQRALSDPHFGQSLVLERTIALVNAAGPPAREPPTIATVERVLADHGEPDATLGDGVLAPLVEVLGELFAVCTADSDERAAHALNGLFSAYGHAPRLTAHDGTPWHLHLDSSDDAPLHEWIATSAALALATLLSEVGRAGWGVCRAEDCGRLFLTAGDGRRRTACSDRCATRARVREHRRRHAGDSVP